MGYWENTTYVKHGSVALYYRWSGASRQLRVPANDYDQWRLKRARA